MSGKRYVMLDVFDEDGDFVTCSSVDQIRPGGTVHLYIDREPIAIIDSDGKVRFNGDSLSDTGRSYGELVQEAYRVLHTRDEQPTRTLLAELLEAFDTHTDDARGQAYEGGFVDGMVLAQRTIAELIERRQV